jgi:hypothetical protein
MSSTKRSHRRYNWRAVDAVAAAVVAVMAAVAMAAAVVAVAMQAALMLAALAVATSAALVAAPTWADALIWEDVTWAGATVVAVAMDAASSSEDASAAPADAEDVAMAAAATPVGYGRRLVGFTAARLTHRRRRKDSDRHYVRPAPGGRNHDPRRRIPQLIYKKSGCLNLRHQNGQLSVWRYRRAKLAGVKCQRRHPVAASST